MANSLESLVNLLESYRGRDKVIRTLCYGSLLAGGIVSQRGPGSSQLGNRLLLFSSQLSDCRTVLRLFDDLSMFAYTWSYGLGVSEEDAGVRWICVINNLADQLYYPLEHIAWAADARLIGVKSARWWTLSTLMWAVSLLMNILRSVRVILLLRKKMRKNRRTNQREGSEAAVSRSTEVQQQVHSEVLSIFSSMADLSNAIHWLPPGFLWSSRFPHWLVGLMGTVSSLIGLYQTYSGRRAND
ncbi:peroxisomal membrane protein 11C isoform X1 [Brienomyrus brachyistius]|uniref:peroxisomal membrane protein 11C isoform X1 n=1 Tax=Brienomyrus brachyistius TaxID=42636 RepID=UPI0020B32015|nr:peroxisomal membrane protein 11C isoform X1 [Brienomyrus brachyistius]